MTIAQQYETLRQGDRKALEQLYSDYSSKVYGLAHKYTNNTTLSEDLVHDVFIHIWHKRKKLSPNVPVEKQVYILAKNVIIDFLRKQKLESISDEQIIPLLPEVDNNPRRYTEQEIFSYLSKLPERKQDIFQRHYLWGWTYKEIGEHLEISENTVRNHVHEGLAILRTFMGKL